LGIGPQEGVLLGANFRRVIVTNGDFVACVSDIAATRPSSQITLGDLFIFIYLYQTTKIHIKQKSTHDVYTYKTKDSQEYNHYILLYSIQTEKNETDDSDKTVSKNIFLNRFGCAIGDSATLDKREVKRSKVKVMTTPNMVTFTALCRVLSGFMSFRFDRNRRPLQTHTRRYA